LLASGFAPSTNYLATVALQPLQIYEDFLLSQLRYGKYLVIFEQRITVSADFAKVIFRNGDEHHAAKRQDGTCWC